MPNSSPKSIKLTFYLTYSLILIAGLAIIGVFCYFDARNQIDRTVSQIHLTITIEEMLIANTLKRTVTDATYLRDKVIHDLESHTTLAKLDYSMALFAKYHPQYNQIRFIDPNGQEIIRINHRDGHHSIVPADKLQNKKERYYFEKSIRLQHNKIYFSPLDLNVENKKIEKPYRPMIRIGTPVFSKNGQLLGVLILNYNAQILLDRLRQVASPIPGKFFVVNANGHFLLSHNPEHEWGNMLSSRQHITFDSLYEKYTAYLKSGRTHHIYSKNGIILIHNELTHFPELKNSDLSLIIIWMLPWSAVLPMAIYFYIAFGLIILILIGVTLWYILKVRSQHLEHEHLLETISKTDPLTQLSNRRELFNRGNNEIKRAQRSHRPFCVLMIDIDFFKKVNDTYGHKYGDRTLTLLAKTIRHNIREIDTAGRYGGEEFIVILPETTLDNATQVGEKLRLKISEIQVPYKDTHFTFTVSIGVCEWSPKDTNLTDTINRSDQCLYQAKTTGRNRVINQSQL